MDVLFQLLSATGDVAMVAVALSLWRHDIRIVRIETYLFGPKLS